MRSKYFRIAIFAGFIIFCGAAFPSGVFAGMEIKGKTYIQYNGTTIELPGVQITWEIENFSQELYFFCPNFPGPVRTTYTDAAGSYAFQPRACFGCVDQLSSLTPSFPGDYTLPGGLDPTIGKWEWGVPFGCAGCSHVMTWDEEEEKLYIRTLSDQPRDHITFIWIPGPQCGDSIVQPRTGEECDDGNRINGDGCNNQCRLETPPDLIAEFTQQTINTLLAQGGVQPNTVLNLEGIIKNEGYSAAGPSTARFCVGNFGSILPSGCFNSGQGFLRDIGLGGIPGYPSAPSNQSSPVSTSWSVPEPPPGQTHVYSALICADVRNEVAELNDLPGSNCSQIPFTVGGPPSPPSPGRPAPTCSGVGPQGWVTSYLTGTKEFTIYDVENIDTGSGDTAYLGIWSEEGGSDDFRRYYAADPDSDGNWTATVDLANHPGYGRINLYAAVKQLGQPHVICGNADFTRTLFINPPPPSSGPAPAVDLTANGSSWPQPIAYTSSATLKWTSVNTYPGNSCSASGGWSGAKPANNDVVGESTGPLSSDTTYTIQCQGPGGVASDDVTVGVGPPLGACNLEIQPTTLTLDRNELDAAYSDHATLLPFLPGGTASLRWIADNPIFLEITPKKAPSNRRVTVRARSDDLVDRTFTVTAKVIDGPCAPNTSQTVTVKVLKRRPPPFQETFPR